MYIFSKHTPSALKIVDWSIRTKRKPTAEYVTGSQQEPLQAFEKQAFVDKLSKFILPTAFHT